MWGSTFSDLARKAQELHEQAQEAVAATHFSVPAVRSTAVTDIFNLDAMQKVEDTASSPTRVNQRNSKVAQLEEEVPSPSDPPVFNHLLSHQRQLSKTSSSRSIPSSMNGKLKVPTTTPTPHHLTLDQQPQDLERISGVIVKEYSITEPPSPMSPPNQCSTLITTTVDFATKRKLEDNSVSSSMLPLVGNGNHHLHDVDSVVVDNNDDDNHQVHRDSIESNAAIDKEESPIAATEEIECTDQISESTSSNLLSREKEEEEEEVSLMGPPLLTVTTCSATTEIDAAENALSKQCLYSKSPPPLLPQPLTPLPQQDQPSASVAVESVDDSTQQLQNKQEQLARPGPTSPPSPLHSHFRSKELSSSVPVHVLEQFSQQLQRLEEHFQAERLEMQQRFKIEQSQLKEGLEASHQQSIHQYVQQISEKEEQLHKIARRNEGFKLRIDVLQREVTGTQQLLETKSDDMGKVNEDNMQALEVLKVKIIEAERRALDSQQLASEEKSKLKSVENELMALKQEHADLKVRVKGVALELKERRNECRELHALLNQKSHNISTFSSEIERLQYQLSEKKKSYDEKDYEVKQLHTQHVDLTAKIVKYEEAIRANEAQSETLITEYKRKANNSLSLANSRAASAIQAKEEAELEARAARTTADSAMARVISSELSSKAAIAEAKATVKQVEFEKATLLTSMEFATAQVDSLQAKLTKMEERWTIESSIHKRTVEELKASSTDLLVANAKVTAIEGELDQSHATCKALKDNIIALQDQLKRAEVALNTSPVAETRPSSFKQENGSNLIHGKDIFTDDTTVHILQEDLREANNAIAELKDALADSLARNENDEYGNASVSPQSLTKPSYGDTRSVPLFYNMETQAELKTAKDEIMRLANLLSNIQSEKMVALELQETMRQRMEEAEARLQRYQKLHTSSDFLSSNGGGAPSCDGAINIEYLKNIILRYLNAKTLDEKKALLPVICAVLCLTATEQKTAMENLEKAVSLGGVGSSLLDTINFKLR